MGINGAPWYSEDIASAIYDAEMIIEKIKTNKYDMEDLIELSKLNTEIIAYVVKNTDKN